MSCTIDSAYVAYLDILGYKELVQNNSHEELKKIYDFSVKKFTISNNNNQRVIIESSRPSLIGDGSNINVQSLMVSDSIIVWSMDNSSKSFCDILYMCMKIVSSSILKYLPVRAAVSSGPITYDYMENGSNNQTFLYGGSIIKAYTLAESTNWIGCVIDDDTINNFIEKSVTDDFIKIHELLNRKILIPYKVPLKQDKFDLKYVVNWTLHPQWQTYYSQADIKFSPRELIQKSFSELNKKTENIDVTYKKKNTIDFLKFVLEIDIDHKNWNYAIELDTE